MNKERLITKEEIQESKDTIYVFGDNLMKKGLGGQAKVARPFVECGKAIGIPTKRAPCEDSKDCYFSDKKDEIEAVKDSFDTIMKEFRSGKRIIFFPNIGTGFAELPSRSPKIHKLIQNFIKFVVTR